MAATIIAALIGAGTSMYAGEQENFAMGQARDEARKLADQERTDTLRANQQRLEFQQQQLSQQGALQREQMGLTERLQSAQIAQQGARDMASRQQEKYSRALGIINSNTQLKNRLRSLFGGR